MQCDYYDAGRCRSCTLIETPYAHQLDHKDARARAELGPFNDGLDWQSPIASAESGFRNKAKMVVGGSTAAPRLGILGPGWEVVDLRTCGLHEAAIVEALPVLAEFVTTAQLTPYDVASRRGELKYVLVTASPEGELMARFVLRSTEALARIRKHLPTLRGELADLAVASINIQPAPAAIIEGEQEILLTDQATLPMRLDDMTLHLGPRSFFQTNTTMARQLYRQAGAWAAPLEPETVWDLYCGVGGFALHLAHPSDTDPAGNPPGTCPSASAPGFSARAHPGRITGIEVSEQAIASARRSATEAGVSGMVRFAAGDATEFALAQQDHPDLVVVNPPRRGIGDHLARWLQSSGTSHVLYSSCNVESLARDLARMPSLHPIRAQVLDMFPQTAHFETLVLLQRH